MDTNKYIYVTQPLDEGRLVSKFVGALTGQDVVAENHMVVNSETGIAWIFKPNDVSLEQLEWLDENFRHEGLDLPDTPTHILNGVKQEWDYSKLGPSPSFTYLQRIEGMSETEYEAFSQTQEYAELTQDRYNSSVRSFIFDSEHGFGAEVHLPEDVLASYIDQSAPEVIDRVRPEHFLPEGDFKEYEDRFKDGYSDFSTSFIVIEMDGQTYALREKDLDVSINPEYQDATQLDGLAGGMHKIIPYTSYSPVVLAGMIAERVYVDGVDNNTASIGRKSAILNESTPLGEVREGGPLGTYYELHPAVTSLHSLFYAREIEDPQALFQSIAKVFEERGIPYPEELLLGTKEEQLEAEQGRDAVIPPNLDGVWSRQF